jgi:hypothetical protein
VGERTDEVRPRLRCRHRLRKAEDEGDVALDALLLEHLAHADAFPRARQLQDAVCPSSCQSVKVQFVGVCFLDCQKYAGPRHMQRQHTNEKAVKGCRHPLESQTFSTRFGWVNPGTWGPCWTKTR